MPRVSQTSFSNGEASEDLLGRVQLADYFISLRTARNTEVLQRGGIRNRAGLKYLAPVFKHDKKVRLIPFVFGQTDTHLLEFGDGYIRVMRNDTHVNESGVSISGATQTDPVVITTSSAHGYSTGDEVFISDVGGMTEINRKRYKIDVTSSTEFKLLHQVDEADIDGTGYGAYTGGGETFRILTIDSPYLASELRDLKFRQSFDVVFLTHPNHSPKKLVRTGLTNWSLKDVAFFPTQASPIGVTASVGVSGGSTVRYAVTAVANGTFEESIAGLSSSLSFSVSGITQANPAVVTLSSSTSSLRTGHEVEIDGIVGMEELNGRRYSLVRLSNTQFELQGIDSTGFTAYSSGGTVTPAFDEITNSKPANDVDLDNFVSWVPVTNAFKYVVYREQNGVFGFVGETRDTEFNDLGKVETNLVDTSPVFRDPFFGPGNAPAAIGSHQQRNLLGGSNNGPATFDASQVGAFNNFGSSSPRKDSDSFQVTLAANSRESIRHFLSVNDLLIFTDVSVKRVTSGNQAFTFETIQVKGPEGEDIGSSQVPPLLRNRQVLFEDSRGGRVYATQFSFAIEDLDTRDISIRSPHLLQDDFIVGWAGVTFPEPIIYMAMESGRALALTFNEETESVQITAWCRWDTKGFFNSVAALRASVSDSFEVPHFVVQREADGRTVQYIEKGAIRTDKEDIRDSFFVDSGLTFEDKKGIEGVSNANPAVVTSTGHGLSDGDQIEIADIEWKSVFDSNFNETFPSDLNDKRYKVRNPSANTFEIEDENTGAKVDGTELPEYSTAGTAYRTSDSLSGFEHLANETLVGLVDGDVQRNIQVDALGRITLPRPAARAHIGLNYISDIETFPLINPNVGVNTGEVKSIRDILISLKDSRGMLIGPEPTKLREWKQRQYEKYGEPTRPLTGTARLHPEGSWDRNGQVFIRQKDPLPLTVLEVKPNVEIAR